MEMRFGDYHIHYQPCPVCAFLKTLIRQALISGIKKKDLELGKTSLLLQAIIHLNKIVNQLNKNSRHDILCHVVSGL